MEGQFKYVIWIILIAIAIIILLIIMQRIYNVVDLFHSIG